jgi:DNA polymerase-3 subunit delta'
MERLTPLPWQAALWRQLATAPERIPHALLFHGARGTGKRHFAHALAHALLCETPDAEGRPCGQCPSCQLLAAENHPDLRWLIPEIDQPQREDVDETTEPASAAAKPTKASREIRIDQVRAITEFLTLAAHRGGRRIVMLAPAESLNGPAANALLKLLEEPPPGAMFLAVTDEIDAVLPTVRSRCVLLRAPVPSRDAALAWLHSQGIADAEDALAEAGGAPMELARLGEDDARRLAPELKSRLLDLLAKGGRLSPADIVAAVPKDTSLGEAIRLFQRWGWDLLAERTAARVRYYPKQGKALAAVARECDLERLLGWLGELASAQATADHPLNARLAVEGLLMGYLDAVRPAR